MPGLNLAVDAMSATPPYEQIRMQVIDAVRSGALIPGDKLPTVRRLAEDLRLAPNTVARSYRALEQDEVIETRGRLGSFVAATGDAPHRQVQLAAVAYSDRARSWGVAPEEALAIVRAALGLGS
ncbi:GntR family transcriptional regulator [Cryobacterium sp.]|jgi:DNA-binding transcriptional regulator YhcF (GntR family)|uniref:GntR family transcriptional regulator n=1 Tax=Cryobacterium sp. TaxID=1926290 RepID=UPI00262A30C7|nr:GntR family transcriptional regulator [Cryobacterium sp.]MCU1445926.1 GntR family transcriptional regulator [Cryobacterium sp.]